MVLVKPYIVTEDPKGSTRKVCERDGVTYESTFFRLTTPESWHLRLKGQLSRDKYRIQSKGGDSQPHPIRVQWSSHSLKVQDYVVAQSDAFEDILVDWRLLADQVVPGLQADPARLKELPEMITNMINAKGLSVSWPYRKPSQSVSLASQRQCYDERLHDVKAQGGGSQRSDLQDFEVVRTLGTGSFGRVLLVKDRRDGQYRALKIIRKEIVIKLKQVEHTANEKNILACVDCPFIIHLMDYFQDRKSLYFLMEYVNGGEMFTHIHRNRYFTYDIARFYAAQVVLAFEYLPENLLIDHQGCLRITDFGFAKMVTDRTWTLCGTPEYLAPEIILSKGYAHAVDWWALGVLMYEMRCGHAPFYDQNQMEMYKKIVEGRLAFPPHFKPEEKHIISQFLTSDLTKRLGNMKGGAREIKDHPYFKGVDWDALYAMKVPSPYIPKTTGPGDASNFDRYDEEPVVWCGDGYRDPYEETFKNF